MNKDQICHEFYNNLLERLVPSVLPGSNWEAIHALFLKEACELAVSLHDGNQSKAARYLKINRGTLRKYLGV